MATLRSIDPLAIELGSQVEYSPGADLPGAPLRLGRKKDRRAAVGALAEQGAAATPALCAALLDGDQQVRKTAARVLARVGDERAIGPLMDALADVSSARDVGARRRRLVARLIVCVAVGMPVIGAGIFQMFPFNLSVGYHYGWSYFGSLGYFLWGVPFGDALGWSLLLVTLAWICRTLRAPQDLARLAELRVIAQALGQIARRHPEPHLREALPDLHASRADAERAGKRTRQSLNKAIRLIEAATAEIQSLPVPSTAPPEHGESLPRPAQSHRPTQSLPRVGEPQ